MTKEIHFEDVHGRGKRYSKESRNNGTSQLLHIFQTTFLPILASPTVQSPLVNQSLPPVREPMTPGKNKAGLCHRRLSNSSCVRLFGFCIFALSRFRFFLETLLSKAKLFRICQDNWGKV
jgi:hypothetical protein